MKISCRLPLPTASSSYMKTSSRVMMHLFLKSLYSQPHLSTTQTQKHRMDFVEHMYRMVQQILIALGEDVGALQTLSTRFSALLLPKMKTILSLTTMAPATSTRSTVMGNGPMDIWIPLTGWARRGEPLEKRGGLLFTNPSSLEVPLGGETEDTYVPPLSSSPSMRLP